MIKKFISSVLLSFGAGRSNRVSPYLLIHLAMVDFAMLRCHTISLLTPAIRRATIAPPKQWHVSTTVFHFALFSRYPKRLFYSSPIYLKTQTHNFKDIQRGYVLFESNMSQNTNAQFSKFSCQNWRWVAIFFKIAPTIQIFTYIDLKKHVNMACNMSFLWFSGSRNIPKLSKVIFDESLLSYS